MNSVEVLTVSFDPVTWTITVQIGIIAIFTIAMIGIVIAVVLKILSTRSRVSSSVKMTKFKMSYAGTEIEYEIVRNLQNIEVAHGVYVELVTRKMAIPVEDADIITEIYDSWYKLFDITRAALKTFKGDLLADNAVTNQLASLLVDILNKGLRPHLTRFQAEFRKWYMEEATKESSKKMSPQEIQKRYPKYVELRTSMNSVTDLLIEYANRLKQIVKGDVAP